MTRILHFSDLHLTTPGKLVSGVIDTNGCFERAIAHLLDVWERFAPISAVVVSGDISDDGTSESYSWFCKHIVRLPAPVYCVPGNHDDREHLRMALGGQSYIKNAGLINWSVRIEGLRIIGLDSLVTGQPGGTLTDETASFLAESLALSDGCPILLVLHHPPIASGIEFMDGIGLNNSVFMSEVIADYTGEIRIACGHLHNLVVGSLAGCVTMVAPAIASTISVDYRSGADIKFYSGDGGFLLHEWRDTFRSSYNPLDLGKGPFPF